MFSQELSRRDVPKRSVLANIIKLVKILIICLLSIFVVLFVLSLIIPIGSGTIGINIILSRDNPRTRVWGIELIAISNQMATIKLNKTGEVVSATKGDRFKCRCYTNLYLIEISESKGEILLRKYSSGPIPIIKGITYKEKSVGSNNSTGRK